MDSSKPIKDGQEKKDTLSKLLPELIEKYRQTSKAIESLIPKQPYTREELEKKGPEFECNKLYNERT